MRLDDCMCICPGGPEEQGLTMYCSRHSFLIDLIHAGVLGVGEGLI